SVTVTLPPRPNRSIVFQGQSINRPGSHTDHIGNTGHLNWRITAKPITISTTPFPNRSIRLDGQRKPVFAVAPGDITVSRNRDGIGHSRNRHGKVGVVLITTIAELALIVLPPRPERSA